MHLSRERIAPVAAAFGAGVALGLSGPLAGKFDHPVCAALNAVFAAGWPWACFAFLVGYVRRSRIESALLSSSALAVGVVVYYVFKALSPAAPIGVEVTGGPVTGSLSGSSSMILFWGAAAFVLGAPVGLLGNIARTPGIGGLPFRLVVPLIAFYETSMRLDVETRGQAPVVVATWHVIRVAAVVAALVLAAHTFRTWRRAARDHSEASV
ncbi:MULTISPECIES: hypothetical protein [Streptomyces]|uniref:Uncharacterized protein n=1 Tax=Streptomyces spororaveus TaxID=284039 RepID=A0ABQ3T9B4_9ACTN|nr:MULTISPECIES: hypothetical protein [Streptomyces]MCM9082588.1 hypothetical protein [Streptomyces spororaveus]MCX5302646.1 hypothetical protein [Streptomyces sp. NBC_00160]GHI76990.1 hypothetical protein Sspor_25510 [Streptomyces spororaveus]